MAGTGRVVSMGARGGSRLVSSSEEAKLRALGWKERMGGAVPFIGDGGVESYPKSG